MITADYRAPRSLDDALALLATHCDAARPLAGGQSLTILLRHGFVAPEVLVDLKRIPGLDELAVADGRLTVGATVTYRRIAADGRVRAGWPLLAEAVGSVGSIHIRNRGTLGGSMFTVLDERDGMLRLSPGRCDRLKYGDPDHRTCQDILAATIEPSGLSAFDVPEVLNVFMNPQQHGDGTYEFRASPVEPAPTSRWAPRWMRSSSCPPAGRTRPTTLGDPIRSASRCGSKQDSTSWSRLALPDSVADRGYEAEFSIEYMAKDVDAVLKSARQAGVVLMTAALVRQLFVAAGARGDGSLDVSGLIRTTRGFGRATG